MRNRRLIVKFATVTILLIALLNFNWDRVELENRAFVVALGIDAGEEEGFKVSMSIIDVVALESGEQAPKTLLEAEGASLAAAMGQIGAKITDEIYFGHTKAIILGEEVLRGASRVAHIADNLARNSDLNIRTIIMATDKAAAEILAAPPKSESLLGLYLANFYNNNSANVAAMVTKLDLENFVAGLRNEEQVLIPKITLEDEEHKIGGVAALTDMHLAGYISEDKLLGHIWLNTNAAGMQIVIDEGDGPITLKITKSRPRRGEIAATGSIQGGAALRAGSDFTPEKIARLEGAFAQKIEQEIEKTAEAFAALNLSPPPAPNIRLKIQNTGAIK
ncbi:MAG: hypothetical protein LBE35_05430 [Clostridiales bacterium]|jgi:Ger(x)C family germination protein|nr:hypothetical protein [Clostridiales bacterium]